MKRSRPVETLTYAPKRPRIGLYHEPDEYQEELERVCNLCYSYLGTSKVPSWKSKRTAYRSKRYRWSVLEEQWKKRRRILVLFQGAPGLGKTTLAAPVAKELNSVGINAIAVEQDTFAKEGGLKNSGWLFTRYLQELLEGEELDVIFSARNNANYRQYVRHVKLASSIPGWECLFLYPSHLDSNSEGGREKQIFGLMVLDSVYQRSEAARLNKIPPHPTFSSLPLGKKFHICASFLNLLEKPKNYPGIAIKWVNESLKSSNLPTCEVKQFLAEVKRRGRRYIPSEEVIPPSLKIGETDWSSLLRTPLNELISTVFSDVYKYYET